METGPVLLQELDYCYNYNHFLPRPTPGYCTFQDSKIKIILFPSSAIHLSDVPTSLSSFELCSAGKGEATMFFNVV